MRNHRSFMMMAATVFMSSLAMSVQADPMGQDSLGLPIVPAKVLRQTNPASQVIAAPQQPAVQNANSQSNNGGAGFPTASAGQNTAPAVKTLKNVSPEVRQSMTPAPKGEFVTDSSEITVKQGETQLIPIAIGHPNRIVTPFAVPKVLKIDPSLQVDVKDNVLYVATNQSTPVTLFVREEGDENLAITLLLFPKRVPPREVTLKLDSQTTIALSKGNTKAEAWEKESDYVSTLKKLLTSVAKGETPSGYTLRSFSEMDELPYCAQPGLKFDFSQIQVIQGNRLKVMVGVLSNTATVPVELAEVSCANESVKAVAAYPEVYLQPGQQSEIYLVMDNHLSSRPVKRRPKLVQ